MVPGVKQPPDGGAPGVPVAGADVPVDVVVCAEHLLGDQLREPVGDGRVGETSVLVVTLGLAPDV